jgi:hypothetical protein
MQPSLVQNLARRFGELGLRFAGEIDLSEIHENEAVHATLIHSQSRAPYVVAYSPSLTGSSMRWLAPHYSTNDRLLVLGPRVTERSAAIFRQAGINYVDQAGNTFIKFDGVHIDVRGRRHTGTPSQDRERQGLVRGGTNLFSTKRSQVIFAVLSWPRLLDQSIRTLAYAAGASTGQTQETLELLEQYGFLDEGRRLLPARRSTLLDQWTAAYPTGLGAQSKAGRFSGEFSDLDAAETPLYIGGEAAVPELLRPEALVLYSDEFPEELIRRHRWKRTTDSPNIFLRHQFWSPAVRAANGVHRAPWLLTYAELMASQDSRQREAALHLRSEND